MKPISARWAPATGATESRAPSVSATNMTTRRIGHTVWG
jgi:hypothetical protein